MDFENMGREQLMDTLKESLRTRDHERGEWNERARILQDLQVHRIELEMQNRELCAAQAALEESRDQYAALYDFAPVAYCTLSDQGLVEQLNLTAATLFGRDRAQVVGRPLLDLIELEKPVEFWRHLGTCAATGKAVISQLRCFVGGRQFFLEAVSVPVIGRGGRPLRKFRTAFTDVTARITAESERAFAYASEQRLRKRLQQLDQAHVDAATVLAAASPSLDALLDVMVRAAKELTRACWARVVVCGDGWVTSTSMNQDGAMDAERIGPELVGKISYGGRELAVVYVGRPAGDPDFDDNAAIALDMLGQRLGNALEIARLRAVEARETFRLAALERVQSRVRNHGDLMSVKDALEELAAEVCRELADVCAITLQHGADATFHVRAHSGAAQPSAGPSLEALSSLEERVLADLQGANDQPGAEAYVLLDAGVPAPVAAVAEVHGCHALVVVPLRARGHLFGLLYLGRGAHRPPFDAFVVGLASDIADRCAQAFDTACLVRDLRASLRWRENVLAMISHDLRNPLSTIKLSAVSLTPQAAYPVERRSGARQLKLIHRSADHMAHMLDDLMSMTMLENGSFHIEPTEMSAIELAEEACRSAEPLLAERGLRFEREIPAGLPAVFADAERIQRVLGNLVGNALKFTPKGGTVRLSVRLFGHCIRYSVADTGPGIPEEQRARLFERYWKGRSSQQGLGLGLFISRSIVDAHKGRIWVESELGKGSTFHFELPCLGAAQNKLAQPGAA